MEVFIVKDEQEGGKKAFELLEKEFNDKDIQVLGLATGSTPESLYREMVASDLDFSDIVTVNLDEYVGLDENHPQSYHYFMNEHLLSKKDFKESFVPDGMKEEEEATSEYDEIIRQHPIDIQILGIGQNGHIGFNEPGTPFDSTTHKVTLTQNTIEANQRFFEEGEEVPKSAYTMGVGTIMDVDTVILLAYGDHKADAIKATLEGPVTEEVPASALQNHPHTYVVIDQAAASKLEKDY